MKDNKMSNTHNNTNKDNSKESFWFFPKYWTSSIPTHNSFLAAVVLAWIVQFIFSICSQLTFIDGVRSFCLLWFSSGAAFFIGTIGGFLFGIPKTQTGTNNTANSTMIPPNSLNKFTERRYKDNTNLEEVSDWLTKIIVGIGIAEFDEIVNLLTGIGDTIENSIGSKNGSSIIATSSIIYGFVCGFLYYYIWARSIIRKTFEGEDNTLSLTDKDNI